MTQYLYDGRKAVNLDLLNGDVGWVAVGNGRKPVDNEVRTLYEKVGLLFRCVEIRADSLADVPWAITNRAGDTLWVKDDEPPSQLMWLENLPELLRQTEAALCLCSEAFWHIEKNRVKVTNLKWFAPITTAPWWGEELGLTYFERNIGVGRERIPVEEMVYFWRKHPLYETLRNVAPAEAAMVAAGVLWSVDSFVTSFFDRGALKAMIISMKGNPPPAERERVKAWWNRTMSGLKNAFKAEVVSADGVEATVVGEGIQELSNTDLTGEKRNDIATTMGIPHSMVFSDAANHATAQTDKRTFYDSTILPDCNLIARQLNKQLLAPYGYHLEWRKDEMDIYQDDEGARAVSLNQLVSAGMPLEMVAEMLGYDLPEGWTYDMLKKPEPMPQTIAMLPNQPKLLTDNAAPAPVADATPSPAKAAELKRFRAWAKKRSNPDIAKFNSDLLTDADKAALLEELEGGADQPFFTLNLPDGPITPDAYKSLLLQLDPSDDEAEQRIRVEIERRFGRELADAFEEQLGALLPANATDEQVRAAVSRVVETSEPVREVLRRQLEQSSSLGVTVALDTLQGIGLSFDWTLAHVDAANFASNYSYELVRGINSTTQARLQTAVNDWFRERTTLPDLVKELQPTFGKRRAQSVAQTETTRAATEGSTIGYEQSGVVAEMEIRTARDELVCPICGPLNGTRVPLRGGDTPPFHPNCRCFVSPVIEEPK